MKTSISVSAVHRRFELSYYQQIGRENVVGPMPPMGRIVKSADDIWKILAFVRSNYHGDPAYKFGAPPDPPNP